MLTDNRGSFKWPTKFSCVLVRDNLLYVNHYNISISMQPSPTDQEYFSVGFRKLKHFISAYLDNGVIINIDNSALEKLNWLESNTIQLPSDPNDYFLAAILYQKFTAIVKEFFSIDEISIDSRLGDSVEYTINHTTNISQELFDDANWWSQDNVNTNNSDSFPSWDDLKIIPLNKFEPKIVIGGRGENR